MANKVVETLSRIYNAAEDKGLIPEGSNPCGLVVKNRERKSERFLTPDQFRRLGRALAEATTRRRVSPYAVAAIRLLILTGCRKREILHLRWEKVEEAHLSSISTRTALTRRSSDFSFRKGPWRCPDGDRAGWHSTDKLKVPENLTIMLLPSPSPELNPVENICQYLRQNWLSNRVFEDYDAIIEAGCQAWNKLIDQPETIMSIGSREWAHKGR